MPVNILNSASPRSQQQQQQQPNVEQQNNRLVKPTLKFNDESRSLLTNNSNSENKSLLTKATGWQSDVKTQDRNLQECPTSCLKIRNMFDQSTADEDPFFLVKIHNDILAKCTHVKSILHISCDKKSKEVNQHLFKIYRKYSLLLLLLGMRLCEMQ